MKNTVKTTLALTAGIALALAAPLAASAHVTVDPSGTGAGSYAVLTFAIPHGCDASATTAIRITVPEQIASVTPTVNPGWDVAVERDGDRVAAVSYTAHAPLPSELRDTFELSLRLPDGAVGDTLTFPVLQSCVEGEIDWAETESGAALPAPVVVLTEATGDGHGHDHGTHDNGETDEGHAHGDDSHGEHGEAIAAGGAPSASTDALARVFGIGGLATGAIGIVVAMAALRRRTAESGEVKR